MEKLSLKDVFKEASRLKASDIHLLHGEMVLFRIDGVLKRMDQFESVKSCDIEKIIFPFFDLKQNYSFEQKKELDFSFGLEGLGRYRGNLHRVAKGNISLVVRVLPEIIPDLLSLGLPKEIVSFSEFKNGLILITGSTGSGKSTTLSALVDRINSERALNIITVEDPIEYVYKNKLGIIKQKEVGTDVESFNSALKNILRQDPDIIVVGELRDKESMEMAIKASETGHLVISTLHTNGAVETIERIVSEFPQEKVTGLCKRLSSNLRGIISQELILNSSNERVLLYEILVVNNAVKNLIGTGNFNQIYSVMESGSKYGMITKEQCLKRIR